MAGPPSGTVTFLFTDIEGSTRLWERSPDAMSGALARHDEILAGATETCGGHVFKTVGDAFCCAFPTASGALEAALLAQRALLAEDWGSEIESLKVRMALHAGAAEERGGDYFGPPVNRVARLLSAGHGGQVLLSHAAQELVRDELPEGAGLRDLGERRLKDLFRPERVFQVIASGLPSSFPPLKTLDARPGNLPAQPTPLVGREREVAEVTGLLRRPDARLLTLTGPGGTGKTRLGLQAAAELIDEFEGGVFFVALAPIIDPELVASAIAGPLGVVEVPGQTPESSLEDYLRDRELLLVLDNFEQVVEAASLIGRLLSSCPGLRVLATSRTALRVYGEQEYSVPPLALPDPKNLPPLETLTQYEAVRLFVERAGAVKPGFGVTNENAPAVAEICVRLDGLPLAIELAAARAKILAPEAMLSRLGSRLKLLRGGARDLPARQQTLRGAIDWSHDLLDGEDRALFRRLSVFVGGFTLEAAEDVCGAAGELDVLDGVESLLGKSLLRSEEGSGEEPRFSMLQTIREYAIERLDDSGEAEAVRARHAGHYLALAQEAEPELDGPQQASWMDLLETEHDNFRALLSSSFGNGDAESGLRVANALWWFWYLRGHYDEGRRWLEEAAALESRTSVARAKALSRAGFLAMIQSDFERADSLSKEGLESSRELSDEHATAVALSTLGYVAVYKGDYERSEGLFREALAVFRRLGNKRDIGMGLFNLGFLETFRDDLHAAEAFFEESLALFEEVGDKEMSASTTNNLGGISMFQGDYGRAKTLLKEYLAYSRTPNNKNITVNTTVTLVNLGLMALFEGHHERAKALLQESLALSRERGQKLEALTCLELLAGVAGAQGEGARAARLWGAADALREATGSVSLTADRAMIEPYLQETRSRMDETAWQKAWSQGQSMVYEEAISYALESVQIRESDGDITDEKI